MSTDLAKLEQLLAIARLGSFTRAAEELGITQPALSRNVSLLESRYGFRIFDRGRGGVSLTPEGTRLIDEAELLIRDAKNMEHNLKLYRRGEAGQLSLGIGPQIAGLLLPAIGAHLLRTRPQVRLHCSLNTADNLMPELMNGNIEMLLCASNYIHPAPQLSIEPVGIMDLGILARADHPLAAKKTTTMRDLRDYPFAIESAHAPQPFPANNGGISCESSHILREIVLGSDALWFSSPLMVAKDIAAGLLTEIPVTDLPFRHVEVGIVRLVRRNWSPAAAAIADHVRTFLAQISVG